jgi:hypothetical protein
VQELVPVQALYLPAPVPDQASAPVQELIPALLALVVHDVPPLQDHNQITWDGFTMSGLRNLSMRAGICDHDVANDSDNVGGM